MDYGRINSNETMNIADLNPDVVLAGLLNNRVEVQTSARTGYNIRCYADGKQPNKGVADEFLSIIWNGAARSRTQEGNCYIGDLALTIFCKTQADNTVKTQRIRQILGQIQKLASGVSVDGFFFHVDPQQVITSTYTDSTGYSRTTVNVEWRAK